MNRQQAIMKAKVIRFGFSVLDVESNEVRNFPSISLAKKASRALGIGVALRKGESMGSIRQALIEAKVPA